MGEVTVGGDEGEVKYPLSQLLFLTHGSAARPSDSAARAAVPLA